METILYFYGKPQAGSIHLVVVVVVRSSNLQPLASFTLSLSPPVIIVSFKIADADY